MKIVCSPVESYLESRKNVDLRVLLYSKPDNKNFASCGHSIKSYFRRKKYSLSDDAWDFLSFALSILACDAGVFRKNSPDGWTRVIDLEIAVNDPDKWNSQKNLIETFLRFLSTDIWRINFLRGGHQDTLQSVEQKPDASCISLISGGLDSLIGAIDLVEQGESPLFVSQIVRGDKQKQSEFVNSLSSDFHHIQINHNFRSPFRSESSQRARSIIFFSYGVVAATLLKKYEKMKDVKLYVCENGLISINPPLTEARVGSLSTRTTHPYFLGLLQELIWSLGFKVTIENPYQFKTKGEMLSECRDQKFLKKIAKTSTSCGRFTRNALTHCGRCVPCLIRRAAFIEWGQRDSTQYVYKKLSINDDQHAGFDDVRSAVIAVDDIKRRGFDLWFSSSASLLPSKSRKKLRAVSVRGIEELRNLLEQYNLV